MLSTPVKHLLTASALCLCVFVAPAAVAADLPDGPGKDVIKRVCGVCHEAEIVAGQARTRAAWTKTIGDMVTLGAQGSDEDLDAILNYVVTNFPKKVNVNKAPAKDLQSVLDITPELAEAIIGYRQKNGDFKSLDDLKKVPGVDAAQLDTEKNRILF
jgi:competence protein ComEA